MNFNSIKVRLELNSTKTERAVRRFQFHKGTIRTWVRIYRAWQQLYFNSIKVRLELSIESAGCYNNGNFNSIKVRLELVLLNNVVSIGFNFNSIKVRLEHFFVDTAYTKNTFQFHKGTIRTNSAKIECGRVFHFNSIKVRLEHNSYSAGGVGSAFQFHKGTIRTPNLEH